MLRELIAGVAVFAFSTMAFAIEKVMETSLLNIESYKCVKSKSTVTGTLETGTDLGGARYKLRFEGESHEIQPLCDVLEVLKKKGHYASLRISGFKEIPNSSTYTGHLDAIIIQPPSD